MATELLMATGLLATPGAPDPNAPATADGWVWAALGVLLLLLAVRAWVVETGHATLGRTPVKITVLTVTCGLTAVMVAGLVTVNGGARLVYLVAHPKEAQALEDAVNAADTTEPPTPDPADATVADDPPDPPSTPTPTATPAPPPPTTRAAPRRPTTRTARPPVRTTAPVAPPATTTTGTSGTTATSTKTTTTKTTTARAGRQDDAGAATSTSRAPR